MSFKLKTKKKESEIKSVRFPLDLIIKINKAIEGNDVSFSNFVIQACEYALSQLDFKHTEE